MCADLFFYACMEIYCNVIIYNLFVNLYLQVYNYLPKPRSYFIDEQSYQTAIN